MLFNIANINALHLLFSAIGSDFSTPSGDSKFSIYVEPSDTNSTTVLVNITINEDMLVEFQETIVVCIVKEGFLLAFNQCATIVIDDQNDGEFLIKQYVYFSNFQGSSNL